MNKVRISLSIVLSVLAALIFGLEQASACSCTGALPPLKEMAEVKAVFTGKVLKLTKIGVFKEHPDSFSHYAVIIELATVIKGKASKLKSGDKITIRTGTGDGDCGYPFEEGEQYLIYASDAGAGLKTDICTRTRPLKDAENEVLELKGRLPKIQVPARPPEVHLKGIINDAGYQGYVFELWNLLHERIFYSSLSAQVLRDGKWEDYPINLGIAPREEPRPEDVEKMLSEERTRLAGIEAEQGGLRRLDYLDRRSATTFFSAMQSQSHPWRIGFRYETERAMDAGKKLSKSHRVVWGPQIEASTEAKRLTFKEAFENTGMIPYPLGTDPAESGAPQK